MIPISPFDIIAKSFKVRNDKPVIDDYVFQCHYKLTTNILLTFCILVTSINLIGNPIECITNTSKKTEMHKVINSYCWMSSLYTYNNMKPEFGLPNIKNNEQNIKTHSYYKWVPFMLFFQAMTFYVPHWIWKIWEGGKIRMITNGMRGFCADPPKTRHLIQDRLVKYFIESFHTHSTYAFGYILCEIMNILNIGVNIYITHKFLGESFLTYGIEVLKYYQHPNYFNPMEDIFPRLTKCNFFKYGPSGTIQNIDAMCILAQNVLNEKIYLLIWIWFLILAIISIFALVYRITIITQILLKTTLLINMSKFTNNKRINSKLVRKFEVGDYILLNFVEKNVHCIQFKEIVEEICTQV